MRHVDKKKTAICHGSCAKILGFVPVDAFPRKFESVNALLTRDDIAARNEFQKDTHKSCKNATPEVSFSPMAEKHPQESLLQRACSSGACALHLPQSFSCSIGSFFWVKMLSPEDQCTESTEILVSETISLWISCGHSAFGIWWLRTRTLFFCSGQFLDHIKISQIQLSLPWRFQKHTVLLCGFRCVESFLFVHMKNKAD